MCKQYNVKLILGYVKNSTQNFNKEMIGPFLTEIQNVFHCVFYFTVISIKIFY